MFTLTKARAAIKELDSMDLRHMTTLDLRLDAARKEAVISSLEELDALMATCMTPVRPRYRRV
jgi:hypothetical protein